MVDDKHKNSQKTSSNTNSRNNIKMNNSSSGIKCSDNNENEKN